MADEFEKGDHVSWKSHGSEAEGTAFRVRLPRRGDQRGAAES